MNEPGLLSAISLPNSSQPQKPLTAWMTGGDGTRLGFRHWQASSKSPVILYLHGIEGHSQWFAKTASTLNSRDITVYALDRRGSGMNRDRPGHLKSYKTYLADLEIAIMQIRNAHPHQPLFLMANCWSAKAAAIIANEHYQPINSPFAANLDGLIFTSPAIYTKADLDMRSKYEIAFSWLRYQDKSSKTWPIPLKTSFFTNNPEYLSYIEDDPWRLKEATAGFFLATFIFSWLAKQTARSISLPLLVIQSGADQIVDIASTKKWYNQVKSKEKAMHIFPETFHSIDFDENCFKPYTDILIRWIKAR